MALPAVFAKFPRMFWLVNTLEMVERGAYYGMLAALPYHLVYNLHFETTSVGLLLSLLTPFLYILPIVSGALAGKYGYRTVLVPAFALITVGYVLAGFVSSFWMMLLAFIILGMGTGTFKPITSGTIATTTSEGSRNLGYSIYYWMINVGSFLVPLVVAIAIPKESYGVVFFLAAGLIAANLVISFFLYRNPIEPDPMKSVTEVLRGAGMVLKDMRFMILLIIYSGFWFMYAVNNAAIVLYMVDFKVVGDWFSPAMVAVVNPITILVVGIWLGKIVERYDSLHCMVAGMTIFILGLLTLGLTTNPGMFFLGIVIFSIGEFVTHPTYISYVSKIAPRDKVPVYMGYSFIPAFIGYTSGNFLVALLYTVFSEEAHRPKFFWAIISSVGLATIAALMLYSQYLGRRADDMEKAKLAGGTRYPPPSEALDETDRAPPSLIARQSSSSLARHPIWESQITVAVALLLIPGLLFGAYAGGTDRYFREGGGRSGGTWDGYTLAWQNESTGGTGVENTDSDGELMLGGPNLCNVTFTLRWTDEPDMQRVLRTYENQPDQFGLEVRFDGMEPVGSRMASNVHGEEGKIELKVSFDPERPGSQNGTGTCAFSVKCGTCGDFTNRASLLAYPDTGNEWTLDMSYSQYVGKAV